MIGRVYAVAVIGVIGIATMAVVVAQFVTATHNSLQTLDREVASQFAAITETESLLASQRSVVFALISPRDRASAAADLSQTLQATHRRLGEVLKKVAGTAEHPVFDHLQGLSPLLDRLRDARGSEADITMDELRTFLDHADAIDREVHADVLKQSGLIQERLSVMAEHGDRMVTWIATVTALLAGFVVPLSAYWTTKLVRRVKRITRTMHSIADCATAVDIPSTVDDDEVGELARAVQAFKRNTIALQRNSHEIVRLNGWFDLALNNMQRGLSIFDEQQCLVMCNDRYREIYELPKHLTRSGTPLSTILAYWHDRAGESTIGHGNLDVDEVIGNYRAALAQGQEFVRVHTLRNNRVIVVSYRPMPEGGWVDLHEDVTDRIQTDETIKRLAQCDLLTGLKNRQSFIASLAGCLGETEAELAVVLLDMGNFKRVNETYGHSAGDEVLKIVAARLRTEVAADDRIARISGDGFGVIKLGIGKDEAMAFARDLCAKVAGPVEVDGVTIDIVMSAGVALAPDHADAVGELMQRAEIALFKSKTLQHSDAALFDPSLQNALRERQMLESDLKSAFELGQLELHYQPIVDIKQRRVATLEALMRWHHPVRGMVPPSVFIPIAEEMGLIVGLGQWAIEQACRDAMNWPDHVGVAVNLSAAQFQNGDIHKIAHAALRASGLPARRLELEVTESLLLRDEARTRKTLKRLKSMGIRIALDDFGTGYASLSYLRSFPFDKIKVDQTFVRDLPRNADCNAIVRSVVSLARMLGMRTVAEGVETPDHLRQVVAVGCDEVQGYHLSRPVPATAVPDVITDCENMVAEAA